MKTRMLAFGIGCAIALTACEREARRFSEPAAKSTPTEAMRLSPIQPGGPGKPTDPSKNVGAQVPSTNPYEENAYAVSQGQRLFSAFNCVGCHGHGGGNSGPALMDDKWIYGHEPANVYATIVQGRPNGMPSFGGKITESQAWQLVAYVRSLSGQLGAATAPSRPDAMKAAVPPSASDSETPRQASTSKPQ